MLNVEKMIQWLQENQNKPVGISVLAYEFNHNITMPKGFKLSIQSDSVYIADNSSEADYQIIHDGEEIEITTDGDLMDAIADGDFEINTDHFCMGFKLL
jgi:hypothetical protein